ncbi:MAG: hypothetical protein AAF988_08890, partial [Pseudomonadota bacterium]
EENNIGSSANDIRSMREVIKHTDSKMKDCMLVADFFTLSQCRDLLFHVQEHRFTLEQIKEILERNNLRFMGFTTISNKKLEKFKSMFPNDEDITSIENWQKFEKKFPKFFSQGMYNLILEKVEN